MTSETNPPPIGLLTGLFNTGTALAKSAKDALVYAAEVAFVRPLDAGYSIAGAVVQSGIDTVGSALGYETEAPEPLSYKEMTERAFQVDTARRLLKQGKEGSPEWDDLPTDVTDQVKSEAPFQGRRKDLQQEFDKRLAEWEEKGGQGEPPLQPLFVKLAVAGSGDGAWRTHCDADGVLVNKDLEDTKGTVGEAGTVAYTKKSFDWNFAGPGGPGSGGMSETISSFADTGPNSIEALALNAGSLIADEILKLAHEGQPIVFLVKGHSRGAVVANRLAEFLQGAFPDASVELTAIDPVPGLFEPGRNHEIDVSNVDESTVVYSVFSGHYNIAGFTPQRVFGASRVIISQQDHGVGVRAGFTYQGQLYKGSRLNSLPAGVYRDMNSDLSRAGELEPIGKSEDVKKAFMDVYTARYKAGYFKQAHKAGRNWDYNRRENIEAVLQEIADEMDEKEWGETLEQTFEGLFNRETR
jgi:hypothetical protein